MAEANGKLVTCDRCGAQVFLKATGEGETDGGYTRWNKFEPAPAGWGPVQVGRTPNGYSKHATICPACTAEWENVMARYMEAAEK